MATNGDKQKQQNCRPHQRPAVWESQRSFLETWFIKEVNLGWYPLRLWACHSMGGNLTSPKCMHGSHEHYKTVHSRRGRRDCGQGMSHPWSKLQMAVRIVSQQNSYLRRPPVLHVWPLPHATALLDSGDKKKISKGTNCTPEDWHQVSLLAVPS